MKIYILTIHCIPNFGSLLQSYALCQYLNENGYEAKVVDYRPSYYSTGQNSFRVFVTKILYPWSYFQMNYKANQFRKKYIPLTEEVKDSSKINGVIETDAVLIAGGDQIWNNFHPSGKDDTYKLCFSESKKKIAFGSSMGRNDFSQSELEDIAEKIKNFSFIGLREYSTVPMLQPYTNVPVQLAPDPVFLLNKSHYLKIAGCNKLIKKPYLLVYMVAKSPLLLKLIEKVAQKRNLKIVHVCGFGRKFKYDHIFRSASPQEMLNLLYYADYVISASFHATVFSIMFHKQFSALLPNAKTNARIKDLLSYTGLQERIVSQESDLNKVFNDINFATSDDKIEDLVSKATGQLVTTLNKMI